MGDSQKKKKDESKKKEHLLKELEEKTKEAEEYLSQLKYIKADFENYKKRIEREKEETHKFASERLVVDILPVVDNLERAIEAGKNAEGGKDNLLEGVEITYNQLMKILEKEGVKCIKAEGSVFDPYIHECIMTENTDKYDEDIVIKELEKGYTMNSKVIRHSKVKIAKR